MILASTLALVVALLAVGPVSAHTSLEITSSRAPVAPDGTTAGEFTDLVMTFIDRDPAVNGISMYAGGTATVTFPDQFVNTGGGPNALVLLQGWPQSPPAPPPDFLWTTVVDGNTVTATLTADFLVGQFGPGVKQVHALLDGFRNPGPGVYNVDLVLQPDPNSPETYAGTAKVHIIPKSRPSINAVSVFSGPPGPPPPFFNAIYQSVVAGDSARQVGLYLWDRGSSIADGVINPFLDVDVLMADQGHGRLVQGNRTVGQVRIDAPPGADDYTLTAAGPSTLGTAAVTGIDVGVLIVTLHTDADVAGDYTVNLRLNNGNTERLFVTAVGD